MSTTKPDPEAYSGYVSTDGGRTWKRVCAHCDKDVCQELVLDWQTVAPHVSRMVLPRGTTP